MKVPMLLHSCCLQGTCKACLLPPAARQAFSSPHLAPASPLLRRGIKGPTWRWPTHEAVQQAAAHTCTASIQGGFTCDSQLTPSSPLLGHGCTGPRSPVGPTHEAVQ